VKGKYGLPKARTYSLIGVYELKDTKGEMVKRLYRVRNPWGADWGYYNGAWNDKSELWTTEYKAQVPYTDADDGIFFIEESDFQRAFDKCVVSYYDPAK
jgi:hypothetical protein